MQRRNLLIGMGSLTAGGAAAVGTGAFTSVEAERSVSVAVADDSNAFLSLSKVSDSANSQDYVDASGNQISLVLDDSDNGGSGFNANAETRIDDILQVRNQGTQTVNVWVTFDAAEENVFDDDTVHFYPSDDTETQLNNREGEDDEVLALTPGDSANIGLFVDLGELDDTSNGSETPTAVFNADVDEGGSDRVNESGGEFITVANDGTGDTSDIQAAINSDSSSTIRIKDTGKNYKINQPIDIDESGITIQGVQGRPTLEYKGGTDSGGEGISISSESVTIENIRIEAANAVADQNYNGSSTLVRVNDVGATINDVELFINKLNGSYPSPLDVSSAGTGEDRCIIKNCTAGQSVERGDAFISAFGFASDRDAGRVELLSNTVSDGVRIAGNVGENDELVIKDNEYQEPDSDPDDPDSFFGGPTSSGVGSMIIKNNEFIDPSDIGFEDGDEIVKFTGEPAQVNGKSGYNSISRAVADTNEPVNNDNVIFV
jgi:hypothetical protein